MIRKNPIILCLYFLSIGFAQSFDNFDVYGGISSVTVSTSDFTNFDEPIIKAGDVEIPMDAVGVVKTDMSATQAGINPEATTSGFTFQVGVVYNLKL